MILYHYGCEHSRDGLGTRGTVKPLEVWNPPAAKLLPPGSREVAALSWFTDLDTAVPAALGLTRRTISCDRTRYRYRVTDEAMALVTPWLDSPLRRGWLLALEWQDGVMPRHWYVATAGVRVVLDMPGEVAE